MSMDLSERALGCLLGLACGDAVGTAVEFRPRGSFPPVTRMTGGGPFGLRAGEWTDDTAMALCLAESLFTCGRFEARDQMQRYCQWWRGGHLSCTGQCFDIGTTTCAALRQFLVTDDPFAGPTGETSAGNGSLMRLAPVALFFYQQPARLPDLAAESSRTTHGAAECLDACRLFAAALHDLLAGRARDDLLSPRRWDFLGRIASPRLRSIARREYRTKDVRDIRGSGYVVESLEAALWAFERTHNFRDAVLAAVNLGDDADTTGAVCGQVAGAHYGRRGIPEEWLDKLAQRTLIEDYARRLVRTQESLHRVHPVKPE